jgi:RHS repeat-associated protein
MWRRASITSGLGTSRGSMGRFTSPDEFRGGIVDAFTGQDIETNTALPYADITDPQTLNKYAYIRNNPLRYIDPTGHEIVGSGPNGEVELSKFSRTTEAIVKRLPSYGEVH